MGGNAKREIEGGTNMRERVVQAWGKRLVHGGFAGIQTLRIGWKWQGLVERE